MVDILGSFSWCFNKIDSIFLSYNKIINTKRLSLLKSNSPLWSHINFISDQHTCNFLIYITTNIKKNKILIHLIVPMWNIIETFMISDIINNNNSMCASIITISNCSETLLSCSVPLFITKNYTKTSLHFYPLMSMYLTFLK